MLKTKIMAKNGIGSYTKLKVNGFSVEYGTMAKHKCRSIYVNIGKYCIPSIPEHLTPDEYNAKLYKKLKRECQQYIGLIHGISIILVDLLAPSKYTTSSNKSYVAIEVTLLCSKYDSIDYDETVPDVLILINMLIDMMLEINELNFDFDLELSN